MSDFKKLFQAKRILAMFLAAVMVVTMLPTTASAASVNMTVTEEAQETDDAPASETDSVTAPEENTSVQTEVTAPAADGTETTPAAEVTAPAADETGTPAPAAEEAAPAADGTEAQVPAAKEAEPVAAEPVTDGEAAAAYTIVDNIPAEYKTAVYSGSAAFEEDYEYSAYYILKYIMIQKDGSDYVALSVYLNDTSSYSDLAGLTKVWKQKKGDVYKPMTDGSVPTDAGDYQLVITIPEVAGDGGHAKAETVIDFTITPATLLINTDVNRVSPGTKVRDVSISYLNVYNETNNEYIYYTFDDPDTADTDESANNQISFSAKVLTALEKTELAKDAVLTADGDYVVELAVSFTDKAEAALKANYVIQGPVTLDVNVSDLIETYVSVESGKKWKDEEGNTIDISKVYDGQAMADLVKGEDADYTVKVYADGEELKNAETTGAWYVYEEEKTVDKESGYTNTVSDYKKLDSAPTEAGEYFYGISYAGVEGVYQESIEYIPVTIEKAKLAVKPVIKEGAVFYGGMTAEEVYSRIDCQVVKAADGQAWEDYSKYTPAQFWGTTYDNTGVAQPYAPDYKLQEVRTETAADGTVTEVKDADGNLIWDDWYEDTIDSTKKYRIVFTGKKAAYNADGSDSYTTDVNDGLDVDNWEFDTEEEMLVKYATVIPEVTAAKKATINIDAIANGLKDRGLTGDGKTWDSAATKVFNNESLYKTRAEYKKAVVKFGEGEAAKEVAKNTDKAITYQWYVHNSAWLASDKDFGKDDDWSAPRTKEEADKLVNDPDGDYWEEFYESGNYKTPTPYRAGIYKLVISYTDDSKEYFAEPETIYYIIEPQKFMVVPDTAEYTAVIGTSIEEFVAELNKNGVKHTLQTVPETGGNSNSVTLNWDEGEDYFIWWRVYKEVEQTDENGNKIKVDEYASGEFEQGVTYKIAAGKVNLDDYNEEFAANYMNGNIVVEGTVTEDTDNRVRYWETLSTYQPVTLVPMGETALTVTVDKTKLTTREKTYDGTAFDLSGDIANGLVKVTKADGTEVTDANLVYRWEEQYEGDVDEPVNAGTYTLYVRVKGDANYKAVEELEVASVTINKAKITVTPVINKDIVAGTYSTNSSLQKEILSSLVIEGEIAPRDKEAFVYQSSYTAIEIDGEWIYDYGYLAWSSSSYPRYRIYTSKDADSYYSGYLKGDTVYTLKKNYAFMRSPFDNNYDVTYNTAEFKTVRGNSKVEPYGGNLSGGYITKAAVKDTIQGMNHTITVLDGIEYSEYDGKEGNFVALEIRFPGECAYANSLNAMYKNSIEAAGGIIAQDYSGDSYGKYITVVFNASEYDEANKTYNKEFQIRWEDGYIENFKLDFDNAAKLGDLRNAVEPKSIAFNSPKTKMVVGEEQQLDVKLTKKQMSDVICLEYKVTEGEQYLTLSDSDGETTDTGYVTALAPGKATVEVYPVKIENGKKVRIQGAKAATVKITITGVAAPKIKKINTWDTYAEVQYTDTIDGTLGYRREIYVMEGKKTINDFDSAIKNMKNNKWEGIFAAAPQYCDDWYEEENRVRLNGKETNDVSVWLDGLEPNGREYTVYVRNVSGIRTLANGKQVTDSAKGVIKNFKTTKSQLWDVYAALGDLKPYYTDVLSYDYDDDGETDHEEEIDYYQVKLSDGSVNVTAKGLFDAKAMDSAADKYEGNIYDLPLSKDLLAVYEQPKLSYAVYDENYNKTSLASVDKKGKVKLNGVGRVWVMTYDSTTGNYDWLVLDITASADSVTGKKMKLQVGQTVSLSSLLTYKEGKKVLTGDYARSVVADDAVKAAVEANGCFKLSEDGQYITAVKAGPALKLKLKDSYIKEGSNEAEATITPTALEPVKNLKVVDVTDITARLTFNYTGGAEAFRFELTDSNGDLLRSAYVKKSDLDKKCDENYKVLYYYYDVYGLTKLSGYNIKVTALYGDAASSPVQKAVKTTNVPASRNALGKNDMYDGIGIYVYDSGSDSSGDSINDYGFVSGNVYTLIAEPSLSYANYGGTDTLTWTSSNSKVASVKANAGSFSAKFTALRAGTTVIEVKSKITKAVIARYTVTVTAVKDAYRENNRYHGDNEPYALND